MAALVYNSYAKINLYLDVLDRRPDGFHNIETIFQTVDLADTLSFEEHPNEIALTCSEPALSAGEDNLVYRAAMLLRQRSGCGLGAHMALDKRIPIAAGLAGGSGNAAAALVGLNHLWDLRWPPEGLGALALELGSDVPYCLAGGTQAATGRGEVLTPLPAPPSCHFVLVHPPLAISAAHAYTHPALTHNSETAVDGQTASFRGAIDALAEGDFPRLVFNRLEAPVLGDHPQLAGIRDRLLEAGCLAAAMSGSGSTVFGVVRRKRSAEKIAQILGDYPTSVVAPVAMGLERQ